MCRFYNISAILTYKSPLEREPQASGDRIIAEYDFHPNRQVQIYDIRSGKSTTTSEPEDFETITFMVDDVIFYNRKPLGDLYLSVFFLKE